MSAPINPADCPCWIEPGVYLEVRKMTICGGSIQWRKQCTRCGRAAGGAIAKAKIDNPDMCPAYDEDLSKRYQLAQREYSVKSRDYKNDLWWKVYDEYRSTDKWRAKRELVLQRDKHLCQACLRNRATEVHHLSYKHVKDEPLFELVSVCSSCHQKITAMDRGEEPTE